MPEMKNLTLASLAFPTENYPAELYLGESDGLTIDRESLSVSGSLIDLGTWFNTAPTGWWYQLFGARKIQLHIAGHGTLRIWGTNAGKKLLLSSVELVDNWIHEFELREDLTFVWVELSSDSSAKVTLANWDLVAGATTKSAEPAKVTVVVPTFGLEEEALNQVQRLLSKNLEDVVARVLVIDQGNSVAGSPRFPEISQNFGDRFELIEQGNFGGSGGYARGMMESQRFPNDAVLLLDDDAVIEPASLRRALVLSEALGRTTIIGTGLISAEVPTHLASLTEGIKRSIFNWGPTDGVGDGRELRTSRPEDWDFLVPAVKSEYSGWWGTLLPAGAVKRVGLPAPFFLKWDDAEYGLRAHKFGLETATVPGISAWHPTWAAKGTVSSWSSWPMHRNRLAVAAAYGSSRGVIWHSLANQIKHVLSLQYDSAQLWNRGLEEFLESPDWLVEGLVSTRNRAQSFLDSLPKAATGIQMQQNMEQKGLAGQVIRGLVGLARPAVTKQVGRSDGFDYSWSKSIGTDGYIIDRIGRTEVLVRDPERARQILKHTVAIHFKLLKSWSSLRKVYGRQLLVATKTWPETLGLTRQ